MVSHLLQTLLAMTAVFAGARWRGPCSAGLRSLAAASRTTRRCDFILAWPHLCVPCSHVAAFSAYFWCCTGFAKLCRSLCCVRLITLLFLNCTHNICIYQKAP